MGSNDVEDGKWGKQSAVVAIKVSIEACENSLTKRPRKGYLGRFFSLNL